MIELTRLNGHTLLVNSDLIKLAEAIPDTTLTLVTGDKLVVLESCSEVLQRTRLWRAGLLKAAWPTADSSLAAHGASFAAQQHHQAEIAANA